MSARRRYLLFLISALLGALVFVLQHRPPANKGSRAPRKAPQPAGQKRADPPKERGPR